MGVTAIIPAYNEAATVGQVIDTLGKVDAVSEIIVVSDGSEDDTAAVARRHGARVIELAVNSGKGAAMTAGARVAGEDILLFLDADLEGLLPDHVRDLIEPLLNDRADMTVGIFSRGRSMTDLAQVVAPHLSGQRAIRKDLFLVVGAERSRFEIEVQLTSEAKARNWRVERVPLVNMTHIMKEEKRGLYRGVVARMGMYKDIAGFFWRLTRRKLKARPVAVLLILACLGVIFNYDSSRVASAEVKRMPDLNLAAERRLLVISPHPDDETLGAGGLIATARNRGYLVKVVFMTNGDGFRRGVEEYNGFLPASAGDFLNYGRVRQQEAVTALASLGVSSSDITFMGYPDGGLAAIWTNYWQGDKPYQSTTTRQAAVPYKLAFEPGAAYTAPALLHNLETIIRQYRPTDICFTDTNDSHPDHWATGAFVLAAVGELEGEDPSFHPRLYTFVIHAGIWQMLPVLVRGEKPLLPPGYLLAGGTPWYKFTLTPEILRQKERAIAAYRTQEMVMPTFLANFERPNEVFARLPDTEVPAATVTVKADGRVEDWPPGAAVAQDPGGDLLTKKVERGGDFKAVYLLQSGRTTYLRLDTWGRIGFPVAYNVSLFLLPTTPGSGGRHFTWSWHPGEQQVRWLTRPADYDPGAVRVATGENSLEVELPDLVPPGEHYLMLAAGSAIGRVPLDRIPWRLVKLDGGAL